MFVDLDWPLNASSLLSASAELLVTLKYALGRFYVSAKRHLKIAAHLRNIRQSLIVVNLFWNNFYLCVSAVLATATCLAGWVAGWVSVTLRYCIKTAKPIWNIFDHLKAPSLLFSQTPAPMHKSKGNPINGGVKYTGVGNLAIFDGNRRLSRKRCEMGRWLLCNVNRKSWVPDWMV